MILGLTVFIFFNIIFLISVLKRDFGIIDIAWGMSFLIIFITGLIQYQTFQFSIIQIIGVLVTLWALRLSGYLFYRLLKKGKEDFRYAAWRKEWGEKANRTAYLRVFMLQAVLSILIASPIYLVHLESLELYQLSFYDGVGVLISLFGLIFESIADWQKNKFKKEQTNKSKLCTIGLWKFSRHPNYFGEAVFWWGIGIICFNPLAFYFAFFGPLLLNFFLLKVSGVTMLEDSYKGREGFEEYKSKTNAFIPWFPRS